MSAVKLTVGQPKTVARVAALYKIEEETPDRLVLRAKKIGAVGAGIILTIFGLIMVWVTYAVVRSRNSIGEVLIAGVFALLLLAGGVGLLRSGLRNKDRIIFDRQAGEVRFDKTKQKDSFSIPFSEIEKFKLLFEDRSFSSKEVKVVFKLLIITKSGDEIKVDEAFKAAEMTALAVKAASICGVPFDAHET
jgi:hypothetical protein